MKKIKIILEALFFTGILPLLVIAELNHTRVNTSQQEKVPVASEAIRGAETASAANIDDELPGLLNSRFIVINY